MEAVPWIGGNSGVCILHVSALKDFSTHLGESFDGIGMKPLTFSLSTSQNQTLNLTLKLSRQCAANFNLSKAFDQTY